MTGDALHALLTMIRLICWCGVKVDDGVNCFKALTRDSRAVAAGGGLEIAVSRELREFGTRQAGLQQYSICAFADALESIPRTLAENSGLDAQVPPSCPQQRVSDDAWVISRSFPPMQLIEGM